MNTQQIEKIKVLGQTVLEILETHISWVLLTQQYAYKIKKPVQFSFLDLSSLDKRKYFCEEEVRLNRRLTQGMYLSVVPIYEIGGDFFLEKEGKNLVDYAVKMNKINTEKQMHLLLEKNAVTLQDIEQIVEVLVPFHQTAEIITKPLDILKMENDFNDLQSVQGFVKKELGDEFEKTIQRAITFSNHFLEKNSALLAQRIERKMVRDGHGDLHSSNIFLDGQPIIFDCIDFNEDFRKIDLLNELAFFCIDLDAYAHEDLAEFFMEKYRQLFPEVLQSDFDAQLFLYYKMYRANIRAKVNALKAKGMTNKKQKNEAIIDVTRYLHLMKKYLNHLEVNDKNHQTG